MSKIALKCPKFHIPKRRSFQKKKKKTIDEKTIKIVYLVFSRTKFILKKKCLDRA